ncbi:tpr repeat-containing [Fusarium longipes]|uniref:Tpr repeat-containing n=1 Tax=Fusarium longipes TaxID=694270 RepID=A0A395S7T4_9HYPO|nr:tpr repeat-containing [Fusarium longipes]
MSVSAVASLRPLRGRCWQNTNASLLSIQLQSRTATLNFRTVIHHRLDQHRFQTTNSSNRHHDKDLQAKRDQLPKKNQPSTQPQITFRQFAGRALAAGLRSLAVAMSPTGIKTAYRQNPGATTLGIFVLGVVSIIGAYTVYLYFNYFYHYQFTRYPKPIANSLRRALYYTNINPDAELALKYYKRAMDQCAEHGLDPYSDEVLGIRIQTSYWLEKITNYSGCLQVLEGILADCNRWISVMEQSVKEGKVSDDGRLVKPTLKTPNASSDQVATSVASAPEQASANEDEAPESLWHKRQRILAKTVGIAIKLGELYADEHVLDPDNSQKHLIWAVETALKEARRRKAEGVKPGEGDWLSPGQMGGAMESLGRDYERKNQFHLAIPLFFQALRLCETPCHRPIIMNNLAASFAQHPIFVPANSEPSDVIKELHDPAMPATRKECLEAAQNWAKNAYQHAKDVTGDERTAECDEACAVALCNWGDVAAMLGNNDLARKKYKQCIEMAGKLGFPDAVKQARSGLAKLS